MLACETMCFEFHGAPGCGEVAADQIIELCSAPKELHRGIIVNEASKNTLGYYPEAFLIPCRHRYLDFLLVAVSRPCRISAPDTYIMYSGRTSHGPLGRTQRKMMVAASLWPMEWNPEKTSISQ